MKRLRDLRMMYKLNSNSHRIILVLWMCAIVIFTIVFMQSGLNAFLFLSNENFLEIFISQVSITFLVLSVISLFGIKSEYIYWEKAINVALDRRTMYMSISSLLTLIASFVLLSINCGFLLIYSYVVDIILLSVITIKIVDIFWDNGRIKKILKARYDMADDKKKEQYLENLRINTFNKMQLNDWHAVQENIRFCISKKNWQIPLELLAEIPEEKPEMFLWVYDQLETFEIDETEKKELDNKLQSKLDRFSEVSIRKHTQMSRELMDMCLKSGRKIIEKYLDDEMPRIAFETVRMRGTSEITQIKSKALEISIKNCNKHVHILMIAYLCVDYDTIDLVLDSLLDLKNLIYTKIQKYFDENEDIKELELDAADSAESHINIFNENEVQLIKNILMQEQYKHILNLRQIKKLKDLAGIQEYEPSAEEIDSCLIMG